MKFFIFLLLITGTVHAQDNYNSLDEYLFNQNFDYNDDGILNENELLSVKEITIYRDNLKSLEGINKLKSIESILLINLHEIEEIKLSNLTKLKTLTISMMEVLNVLEILNLPNLESIDISWVNKNVKCNLDSVSLLNIKGCAFRGIEIDVDYSKMQNLESLFLVKTNISKLDLTKSPKIKHLHIGSNYSLKELNFSNNKELKEIEIGSSSLKSIDLSSLINLESVCIRCLSIEKIFLNKEKYNIQKELVKRCFLNECKNKVKIIRK